MSENEFWVGLMGTGLALVRAPKTWILPAVCSEVNSVCGWGWTDLG